MKPNEEPNNLASKKFTALTGNVLGLWVVPVAN
jgi:hypothetical protein